MRHLFFLFLTVTLFSCNNNNALCDCVEAGEEVNRISASFFDRTPTQAGKDSLVQAKKHRDEICAPFQEMMPKELHKKAAECESLEFTGELK
ncbi:hypothetical protein CW751_01045 [Brumimicrobium salinarum]|uniref:Lipoprotein n=1 Tax=Brumimicrobium salinarum TaxID=2058658 RepID=A0A2I0R5U7_9FLAO|nr:hypothetical protein [Brumimicrobium salinarum]PKR81954.1 hypothetical protein CW751_01045 [Brumimicrobium salinarum]